MSSPPSPLPPRRRSHPSGSPEGLAGQCRHERCPPPPPPSPPSGARIRLAPQKDWPVNAGMDEVLSALTGIKYQFDREGSGGALSWSDLIVLAGDTALAEAGGGEAKV